MRARRDRSQLNGMERAYGVAPDPQDHGAPTRSTPSLHAPGPVRAVVPWGGTRSLAKGSYTATRSGSPPRGREPLAA